LTVREALQTANRQLEKARVPQARLDARLLLSTVLQKSALDLVSAPETSLSGGEQARFFALTARRAAREPLQYILGQAFFMGHEFLVRPGVLIPRQDTETLCERAIALTLPGDRVLDLCCGSGCLAISLKLACPEAEVWAGDLSDDAITLSKDNGVHLNTQVNFRQGDLLTPFSGLTFHLILSNPPYIPSFELPNLQQEVHREPALALDGGTDGLHFYRRIFREAASYLAPGGYLLMELGDRQAEEVSRLCPAGFEPPVIRQDLSGLPRVLETRRAVGVH
jgi:release factor glutamine methyltransferase